MKGGDLLTLLRLVITGLAIWTRFTEAVTDMLIIGTFSDGPYAETNQWIRLDQYKSLMTVFPLAIEHFNTKSDAVLELSKLKGTCNETMRYRFLNDGNNEQIAMDGIIQALAANAQSVAKKSGSIAGVLGPIRSAIAQPVASAANAMGVPVISEWATSSSLSCNTYPYFGRTTPSDSAPAMALADLFEKYGYKRVGLLYADETYGNGWKTALFAACEAQHGIRLTTILFDDGDPDSIDNAVQSLKTENLNVIVYIFLNGSTVAGLAKAAKKHGMLENRLWISTIESIDWAVDKSLVDDTVIEFLRGSIHVLSTVEGLFKIPGIPNAPNPKLDKLIDAWTNSSELFKDGIEFSEYLLGDRTNFTLPVEKEFFQDRSKAFAAWAWAYDAVISFGLTLCKCNVEDNGLLYCGASNEEAEVRRQHGPSFFRLFTDLKFQGVSGDLAFESSGDRTSETGTYILRNVQVSSTGELVNQPVGYWKSTTSDNLNGRWTLAESIMRFGTEMRTSPPLDTTPPFHDIQTLPVWAKVMGYVETTIVIASVLWTMGFMKVHKTHNVIIKSQPHFLMLLNLGCFTMGAAIAPLTVENSASCMAFPWLFGVGFTLALSALAAKSWRVFVLWRNPGFFKSKHTKKGEFYVKLIMAVVFVEVCLLIAWSAVAPLRYVLITTVFSDRGFPLISYGTCLGSDPGSGAFLGVLLTLNAVAIIVTIYISYQVKNAPEEFHEAQSTFIAGCAVTSVYFLGIPTVAALYSNPVGRFLGLSSITFLSAMALILAMYVPRVMAIRAGIRSTVESNSSDETRTGSPPPTERRTIRPMNLDKKLEETPPQIAEKVASPRQLFSRAKAVRDEGDESPNVTPSSENESVPSRGGSTIHIDGLGADVDIETFHTFSKGATPRQSDLEVHRRKRDMMFHEVTLF